MTDEAAVFACRMCGECCRGTGGIVLRGGDEDRLAAALGLSPAAFRAGYAEKRRGKSRLRTGSDGSCIFFRDGSGCGVHAARPDICRAWPFFRGNLIDPHSLALAGEGCPGIAAGVPFERFARAGKAYLRRHGLAAVRSEAGCPNALVLDAAPAETVFPARGAAPARDGAV